MTDGILTRDQILSAAQDVLRRYGPAKATVVDVARALGVSHGSVYRHFPSKAALREAVTQRWLEESHVLLAAVMTSGGPAGARLRAWSSSLFAAKRKKALDDPELFATYMALVGEASEVIDRHVADLVGQLQEIISDGVAQGEFAAPDPASAARAVFDATIRFHDPAHAGDWGRPGIEDEFDAVHTLILAGLARR
ncbi:TetR family transcriptional regulator [Nonomuraea sp. LPB2021202275-12-8]|uniref:TetR family transcriptional regulator n=1 Tax=Nonomuraea sp. LPB2021202275-12-8 TaxID=3120159 RepID=UPI00300D5B29